MHHALTRVGTGIRAEGLTSCFGSRCVGGTDGPLCRALSGVNHCSSDKGFSCTWGWDVTRAYVLSIRVVSGNPNGVRVVGKSNWTGRGITFSRSDLDIALKEGLGSPGVYILLGDDPDQEFDGLIYVGQAEDVGTRLKQHQGDDKKDFWTHTVVFMSIDSGLNRAHIRYLEFHLLRRADSAGRLQVKNGNRPSEPALSNNVQIEAEGFLSEILTILPVLGVSAFDQPIVSRSEVQGCYFLGSPQASAEGIDRSDGFLVLEGSKARLETFASMGSGYKQQRERLIKKGVLVKESDAYRLVKDHLFPSPSAAAEVLLGRSANGRIEWRDENKVTLKQNQVTDAGGLLVESADN